MTTKNNILNKDSNWEYILNIIKQKAFYSQYPDYIFIKKEKGYYLIKRINKDNYDNGIFLFKQKIKLKIFLEGKGEDLDVYTSIEIEEFIKSKNLDIKDLFIKDTNLQYLNIKNELGYYIKNRELEIKLKNALENLFLKDILEDDSDYTPEQYSKYFYKYFKYEDENQKNQIFVYERSKVRIIIENNIIVLRSNKKIKKFLLTGPTSIGKSFTLFRISRIFMNCVYLNLKILNDYKEDIYSSYSIIISELERLDLESNINELNAIIQDNYSSNNNYFILLLNIIKFLKDYNYLTFVFIFDQYKKKYVDDSFFENIKRYDNIKYVLCSSINDKNLREECLKTWTIKGKNILVLTEDIQDYYIYYSSLYYLNNKETNINIKKVGNIRKYQLMFKENKQNENKLLKKIKSDVLSKIDEFCENTHQEKKDVLIHLKYIINKEYMYDSLERVIKYCPLKYFFVYFTKYNFRVMPMFPHMMNIIKTELTEQECFDYFEKEKYKNNTVECESVKGYYFEESAKFGLQKIIKNAKVYKLKEIESMDEIIDQEDEIEEEYIEIYNCIQKLFENKDEEKETSNINNNIETDNNSREKKNEPKKDKNIEETNKNNIDNIEEEEDEEDSKEEIDYCSEFLEENYNKKTIIQENNKENENNRKENALLSELLKEFDITLNRKRKRDKIVSKKKKKK